MSAWPTTRLEDLVTKVGSGATPRGGKRSYKDSGIPLIRSMNVHFKRFEREGLAFIDDSQAKQLDNVLVHSGDVLLNITGASIGRVTLAPPDMDGARVNQHVCIVRPKEEINSSFLRWFFASPGQQRRIEGIQKGVTRPALTKQQILNWEVPVPDRETQNEVVAKIEELFSDLDAGVAALERARANLKRYRASVLKAAVEGKLTEQWRAEHPDVEPASALLERILVERRKKWEEEQFRKYRAAGESPPQGWQRKYKDPFEPKGPLPALPPTWCWASTDQLTDEARAITYGVVKLGEEDEAGVPTLRSSNVRHLHLDLSRVKRIAPSIAGKYRRTFLRGGEILVTIRGTLGGVVVVPRSCQGHNISREVAMLALIKPTLGPGLAFFIGSKRTQNWILENTRGIAYTGINIDTLKRMPIPLAPAPEMNAIVELVDRQLDETRRTVDACEQQLARSNLMRQVILRDAFEGRLSTPLTDGDQGVQNRSGSASDSFTVQIAAGER